MITAFCLRDIPLEMVVGTVTKGRQSAFSCNFMPLLPFSTEFARKWSNLYDIQVTEGYRDPIIVTEFMHRFYVQEGNKRVSVLKFLDAPTVSAKVTRLYPGKWDSVESRLYGEFCAFWRVCPLYEIEFSREGSYETLAKMLGQNLIEKWPQKKVDYLRHTFLLFKRAYLRAGGDHLDITPADAMLVYLNVYNQDRLLDTPTGIVVNRLCKIWRELVIAGKSDEEKVDLVEAPSVDEEEAPAKSTSGVRNFFMGKTVYSAASPLRIAFIHEFPCATSSCTPTGCCITILQQRKDCFNLCSIFTVISHEKHLIGTPLTFTRLMQRITRFHYFVSVFSRLFPLCRTSINFGIQIKARKQHPTGSLVSPAISIAFRGFHRSNAAIFSNQFTFNKIIYLFASSLRSSIRRNLSQERNISKTVHQMKIIKRTEKTNFSSHSCIIFSSFSQIEVAHCHSKIKADDADVMAPATKKAFTVRVLDQMPKATPGPYNEALMELGALVCIPGTPHCEECPLADLCRGYAAGRADQLPVKPAPKAKGKVPVTVALIESEQGLLLQRRPARGLLAGLWQPAAWEKALTRDELTAALAGIGVQAALDEPLPPAKHVFTKAISSPFRCPIV